MTKAILKKRLLKPEIIKKITRNKELRRDLMTYFDFIDSASLRILLDRNSPRLLDMNVLFLIGEHLDLPQYELTEETE
ncbi:MAG: hypothetical protein NTX61_08320 [Bacteroidetes bacterium]|nr:hypothetical protein [Bacteroidota bacterium]